VSTIAPPVAGHAPPHIPLPPEVEQLRTLPELFAWRVRSTPALTAYRAFDPVAGAWRDHSWADMGTRVARWSAALAAMQLPRGAKVAILLPNGIEAVCIDQAAMASGCTPLPLHAMDNPGSIAYILGDAEAAVLVADSMAAWRAVEATGAVLPTLKQVVVVHGPTPVQAGGSLRIVSLADWLAGAPADVAAVPAPGEEDLATLVYTSGTTGKPKGVMLTHRNVMSNVKSTLARVKAGPEDVMLSFLPLSHTFERTAGYYVPMAVGCCVVHARSVQQLAEDLRFARPTILVSVPRIYERVYAKLHEMLQDAPAKQRLFEWAVDVGWRRFRRAQGLPPEQPQAPAWLDALAWPLLDALVGRTLRAQFGGRLRLAVSGGAPLSGTIARCFLGLGVPILQGYGMTETSPVVAANAPDDNDPATVGRVVRDVEVRIGDNQELQVRGPNVMKGYWKREEDTARTFVDGWLRTGDQAAIEHGRVRILGRVKEIIVTSTGEKIAPVDVELAITSDPLFEQAFVFGDNRPFIACMVQLNREEWQHWAAEKGWDATASGAVQTEPVRAALQARIDELTKTFPRYAQPRAVWPVLEPWTIEDGLMTPTLKLKRNHLTAHYREQIEGLYRR
jgi:long-chain acyl-CoA synthetase